MSKSAIPAIWLASGALIGWAGHVLLNWSVEGSLPLSNGLAILIHIAAFTIWVIIVLSCLLIGVYSLRWSALTQHFLAFCIYFIIGGEMGGRHGGYLGTFYGWFVGLILTLFVNHIIELKRMNEHAPAEMTEKLNSPAD